ncbi:sulfide-dependent adenosine diphosphate thiazole synthase [Thermodesulforhabdus norvegica]|uniref:Thiamine thiazole synthase n=1 Tax=Thermodesulforhabdus norvegica TaxID=39841 RepID=A0A1I4SAP0_9BACT|nr:sulfide-dependent adenosine diphosphate thiazole synthase [Thermodesulforhabdus norvegica]SFM61411.1 thiazole-adenylate synthase [Thermodesulforhabdus norvegica]
MAELNEIIITRAIIDRYHAKITGNLDVDVAIVGAGPSGLVAGYHLAQKGYRVTIFERKLSVGGGIWGGGMLFNEIVVQDEARRILEEFGVRVNRYEENYYTADAIETVSLLAARAIQKGVTILNGITVEDVVMRPNRVIGLVILWSAVEIAGLHVDPLAIRAKYIVDATGHDTEVVKVVHKKVPGRLMTPTGNIEGEKSMWSEEAEKLTLENTREVFPGLFVAGMAANATFGGPRMGPIFGGMLLSGEKVAHLIDERLKQGS